MTSPNVSYTSDGTTRQYAVPFEYIDAEHIEVHVGDFLYEEWTLADSGTVLLHRAPAAGVEITVARRTPIVAPLATLEDTSTLIAQDLNLNARQAIFAIQEAFKLAAGGLRVIGSPGNFDAGIQRIANVGDAVSPSDAVNLAQVHELFLSSLASTVQQFNGVDISATPFKALGSTTFRTLAARARDEFNVRDYGALGNGLHDDAPAFQAAIAAAMASGIGGRVRVPAGTYGFATGITMPASVNGVSQVDMVGDGFGSVITPLATMDSMVTILGGEARITAVCFANAAGRAQTAVKHSVPEAVAGPYTSEIARCYFTSFPSAIVNYDGNNLVVTRNFFNANSYCFVCLNLGMGTLLSFNTMLGGNGIDFRIPRETEAEGVQIIGNNIYPSYSGSYCIRIQRGLEFQIGFNVLAELHGPGACILLDASAANVTSIKIENNWLGSNSDVTALGGNGIHMVSRVDSVTVQNNTFSVFTGSGVYVQGNGTDFPAQNLVISSNRFYRCTGPDLYVKDVLHAKVFANTFHHATNSIVRVGTTTLTVILNTFAAQPDKGPTDVHLLNTGQNQGDSLDGVPIGLQTQKAGAFKAVNVTGNVGVGGSLTVVGGVQGSAISSTGTLNATSHLSVGGNLYHAGVNAGFCGASPIPRQPAPVDLAGVITVLRNFGLVN